MALLVRQVAAPGTRPDGSAQHTVFVPEALKAGTHFLKRNPQADMTAVLSEASSPGKDKWAAVVARHPRGGDTSPLGPTSASDF